MRQYLMLILVATLVLTSGLAAGCDKESSAEREQAVTFFQGAYPVSKGISEVADDWTAFNQHGTTYGATPQEISDMAQECASRLQGFYDDLSMLYAPTPLRQLKDDLADLLTSGIEAYTLVQQCAATGDFSICNQADSKLLNLNKLINHAADEWDDGLAYYHIKASEIVR
jgi:hypothetical protein